MVAISVNNARLPRAATPRDPAVHIVFVTTELAPLNPGGAGTLVARLRDRLIDRGDRVSVILVADHDEDVAGDVTIVGTAPDFESRALVAAEALQRLVAKEHVDLVEIQDFDGLAFHALSHRGNDETAQVPVQVRFHGPADLMFEAIGTEPPEIAIARTMETESYRMADRVLVPSPGIGRLAAGRYNVEPDRIFAAPPPLPTPRPLHLKPSPQPTLVCLGRLAEVKGTHDLIAASIPILRQYTDARIVIIGEDGWSATANKPMSEWLTDSLIPDDVSTRIELAGRLEGEALDRRLAEAWAVVIPSRFESFNLAAHEARVRGLPVVIPDLPAFAGILNGGTGALVYDGTVPGLTEALQTMITNDDLRDHLARAPRPELGDPLLPYDMLPTIRHTRAQAGLATQAVQRFEALHSAQTTPTRSSRRRAAGTLLGALPAPVAGTAVKVLPKRWADRFGFITDWRQAQERRNEDAEAAALARRLANGEFPLLDNPRVSIVIPCYNQGVFLNDAIGSVFKQTFDSFEVIVVDDGSTHADTIEVIDALSWSRTRVIRRTNGGLAAARNAGIEASLGEFVVPLDADDAIEPQFLELLVAELDANPGAGYATCRTRLFGDIDAVWCPRPFNPYQLLLSNSNVGCVLLRRDAWDSVDGYDEAMRNGNEDWELWIRLMQAGWDIVEVPQVLFRYRKHGISMSVDTEARFEQGRAEVVGRHPYLYATTRLAELKREHYPFVSIIIDANDDPAELDTQQLADAEVIVVGSPGEALLAVVKSHGWPLRSAGTATEAVQASRGKHVTRWSDVTDTKTDTLECLADALESDPSAGSATSTGSIPLVVVRRWSLHDPDGPSKMRTIDDPSTARDAFSPGGFPDPAWIVPSTIGGLPVQRQRPEEDGRLPTWVPQ